MFSANNSAYLDQIWSRFVIYILFIINKGRKKHKRTNKAWNIENKSLGWEFLLHFFLLILYIKSVQNVQNMSVSNKCCSFERSIQGILRNDFKNISKEKLF